MENTKKLDFTFLKSNNNENNKVIIGFHGWQGNKNSFLPMAKHKMFECFDWYMPEAPYLVDNNQDRRSWSYQKDDETWEIKEPHRMLNDFFEVEIFKKYDSKNVYIIGFSQGALICYEFVCKLNKPLGAIFPVSGFLKTKKNMIHPSQKNTPIIIGHGLQDDIVSIEKSKEAHKLLINEGASSRFVVYDAGHHIPKSFMDVIIETINANN